MYKHDLALNNQQWLICHKSQLNLTYLNKQMPKLNIWPKKWQVIWKKKKKTVHALQIPSKSRFYCQLSTIAVIVK